MESKVERSIATIVAYLRKIKPHCYHIYMEETPYLAAAFGQTLRSRREQAGLTQEALAAKIGSVSSYVRFLEYGQKMPTINTFHLLCAALGADPHEFMSEYLLTLSRLRGSQK